MRNKRQTAHRYGVLAEEIAAWYLRLKGYRICAMRYRNFQGEIDIIATKGTSLIAIEVKARKNMQACAETITPQKQQRMMLAMQMLLAGRGKITGLDRLSERNIRFDVVWIAPWRLPVHLKDAFR